MGRRGVLNSTTEPQGTLEVALAHATRLLAQSPNLAVTQAQEILNAVPGHPQARLILGAARRSLGNTRAALEVLELLAQEQPQSMPVHLELGVARSEAGLSVEAVASFLRATQLKPDSPDAWRLLADQWDANGDSQRADAARARYLKTATKDPQLLKCAAALVENNLPEADALLRAHLQRAPNDVAGLRMLAEVAARLRRYGDAQELLERCLKLSPSFDAARHNYAVVLNRQGKAAAALPEVQKLLAKEPRNPNYRNLNAAVQANLGNYNESILVYEAVLKEYPEQPNIWMSYGHSLKTARRQAESIAAYRRAIALKPSLGEAYWSLANLKTFRFTDEDMGAMDALLKGANVVKGTDLDEDERVNIEFSLGKAFEDQAQYKESFEHYQAGNDSHRRRHPYSADENTSFVRRSMAVFTPEFFAARVSGGDPSPDPIFIVGLPRAGSTLIEQILASHSLVEGTMELPDIPQIARELADREANEGDEAGFLRTVSSLSAAELRGLGERYMASTRVHRKTGKPFFIDKMPNNCLYVGLIQLILPNARIIDARRHPLGCCFSGYKQHFARGQNFTYGLEDIGRYYGDYVQLMDHVEKVLPGRVHRLFYEDMIENTEAEVRRLLDYCGLSFEPACLKFYDNPRAVRTASSEQVRQPIFREGVDFWQHYEPWLAPLKEALGPALTCYPAATKVAQ